LREAREEAEAKVEEAAKVRAEEAKAKGGEYRQVK